MKQQKIFINLIVVIAFCGIPFITLAQKLPSIQTESLFAPSQVKIDGNIYEWGDKLLAFNNRVTLFYTVANDNENLYFIIRSENSLITSKIMAGGIKILLNPLNRKENGGISITYPLLDQDELSKLNKKLPPAISDNLKKAQHAKAIEARETAIAKTYSNNIDSYKSIRVLRVKEVDTLISVYNDYNIKVKIKIDDENALNYELSIPLKYLSVSAYQLSSIFYNIKLLSKLIPSGVEIHPVISQNGNSPLGPGGVDRRSMLADTDFWGKYTLAKKHEYPLYKHQDWPIAAAWLIVHFRKFSA